MSSRAEAPTKGLVAAVLVMTVAVLGLGGAILVLKLKPAELPTAAGDRTVELWRRAVATSPDDDRAHVGLGLALLETGQGSQARAEFEEALRLNSRNWVALTQLGILQTEEDPERALDLFHDAARWAPDGDKVVPLVYEGDLLMQQGQAGAAKKAYRRATLDAPVAFDAHLGLARALEALGNEADALEEYEEAARYDPSNAEIAEAIARLADEN